MKIQSQVASRKHDWVIFDVENEGFCNTKQRLLTYYYASSDKDEAIPVHQNKRSERVQCLPLPFPQRRHSTFLRFRKLCYCLPVPITVGVPALFQFSVGIISGISNINLKTQNSSKKFQNNETNHHQLHPFALSSLSSFVTAQPTNWNR